MKTLKQQFDEAKAEQIKYNELAARETDANAKANYKAKAREYMIICNNIRMQISTKKTN
jgi:hypothetical protein